MGLIDDIGNLITAPFRAAGDIAHDGLAGAGSAAADGFIDQVVAAAESGKFDESVRRLSTIAGDGAARGAVRGAIDELRTVAGEVVDGMQLRASNAFDDAIDGVRGFFDR